MFEVSFWKVLPSHVSLVKKKKDGKKKKKKKKEKKKKHIYTRTFPAYFLVTSMGKYLSNRKRFSCLHSLI